MFKTEVNKFPAYLWIYTVYYCYYC